MASVNQRSTLDIVNGTKAVPIEGAEIEAKFIARQKALTIIIVIKASFLYLIGQSHQFCLEDTDWLTNFNIRFALDLKLILFSTMRLGEGDLMQKHGRKPVIIFTILSMVVIHRRDVVFDETFTPGI